MSRLWWSLVCSKTNSLEVATSARERPKPTYCRLQWVTCHCRGCHSPRPPRVKPHAYTFLFHKSSRDLAIYKGHQAKPFEKKNACWVHSLCNVIVLFMQAPPSQPSRHPSSRTTSTHAESDWSTSAYLSSLYSSRTAAAEAPQPQLCRQQSCYQSSLQ